MLCFCVPQTHDHCHYCFELIPTHTERGELAMFYLFIYLFIFDHHGGRIYPTHFSFNYSAILALYLFCARAPGMHCTISSA